MKPKRKIYETIAIVIIWLIALSLAYLVLVKMQLFK